MYGYLFYIQSQITYISFHHQVRLKVLLAAGGEQKIYAAFIYCEIVNHRFYIYFFLAAFRLLPHDYLFLLHKRVCPHFPWFRYLYNIVRCPERFRKCHFISGSRDDGHAAAFLVICYPYEANDFYTFYHYRIKLPNGIGSRDRLRQFDIEILCIACDSDTERLCKRHDHMRAVARCKSYRDFGAPHRFLEISHHIQMADKLHHSSFTEFNSCLQRRHLLPILPHRSLNSSGGSSGSLPQPWHASIPA